ncbi:hypothetical protein HDU96_000649 [Phlyctochytrium bullatum]|nr:hypothetical protein HDU96_000649 [Phlyctochytrium bullatum]
MVTPSFAASAAPTVAPDVSNSTFPLSKLLPLATGLFTYLEEKYPHEFYLALVLTAIVSPFILVVVIGPMLDYATASAGGKGSSSGSRKWPGGFRSDVPETHRDRMVLHVYPRPRKTPGLGSLHPLCLKLEAVLRVSQTPYIRVTDTRLSSKGRKPYITYNGEEIADPWFCLQWLENKHGISLDANLEESERGAVEAYRTMIEEGLYWQSLYWIWAVPSSWDWVVSTMFDHLPWPMTYIIPFLVRRRMLKALHAEGTSRHTREEIIKIMDTRIDALSVLLANDTYLLGSEEPTSLDCTAYAHLLQLLLQNLPDPTPRRLVLRRPNLVRFLRRMSETYFGDVAGGVDWDAIEADAEDEADEDYLEEEEEEDEDDEEGMDEADAIDEEVEEEEVKAETSKPTPKAKKTRSKTEDDD